ncbi:MAG TPA: carbamoyltransferase C-terminal domain-containing protein, partial [Candidatus Sulfotelmatobacter sp.]|nr:carbamoyltransferase C-terminal domain-containing protein [Candidatus Sulfotelmatobacter sp.]
TQGLPEAAIQFCLVKGNVSWADLDVIALANDPYRSWSRRALSRCYLSVRSPLTTVYREGKEMARFVRDWTSIHSLQRETEHAKTPVLLDHHSCHISSAFFLSPFDKALILTLDGERDGRAGTIAVGEGNQVHIKKTIALSNSVGRIYSCITRALGFVPFKEEHKTQWLSLEGEPVYQQFLLNILRRPGGVLPDVDNRYFHYDLNGALRPSALFWKELGFDAGELRLTQVEKRNLASSLQGAATELISNLLAAFQKTTGLQRICLGGGVFHNTLLVAALERKFGVGNVFVPPAPGNAGCALGAAAWIWHHAMNRPRKPEIRSVYWGPSYARTEIKDVLDNVKSRYLFQNTTERKLDSALQLLRSGKIVGWFHGAAEFGPRALGHRSILASPWAPYVTENLNDFVKHRESFRPFAVSVREEDCAHYFSGSSLCHLMNSLASVRPEADVLPRSLQLPGGLVRLHIVEKHTDPLLWELLGRFGEDQPAPILVNTSFNLPGEPPVIRPKDAVRTFFCSGLDAVFVDNFLLTKVSAAHLLNDRLGEIPTIRAKA